MSTAWWVFDVLWRAALLAYLIHRMRKCAKCYQQLGVIFYGVLVMCFVLALVGLGIIQAIEDNQPVVNIYNESTSA